MENEEGNVREMTRAEKNFYNGVTIDASSTDSSSSEENFRAYNKRYNYSTRSTYINVSGSNIFTRAIGSFFRALLNGNRLAQIAACLIGLALAALIIFVALPIVFVLLAVGIALVALAKISR